jgi:hypothetical protein
LANVHLQEGPNEFCWNLHDNGKFYVGSMYSSLIQHDISIDKVHNDKLWKLKSPYGSGYLDGTSGRELFSPKIILQNKIGMTIRNVFFYHQDETIQHLFFQCLFARSIWSVIQLALTLYQPNSVANIFGN